MTLHEDDGDFDVEATTKDGTTATLSGTLGVGNKGAYGTGDLDLTDGLEAPLSVMVNGKLKSAGHVFTADLLGISAAPEFALTKGKITGKLEEEDGHDESVPQPLSSIGTYRRSTPLRSPPGSGGCALRPPTPPMSPSHGLRLSAPSGRRWT